MNEGWIYLHRKIFEWEWYDDANTFRLFIHCLLKANFEDKKWHNINIKRGQFFTSILSLSHELKLTTKQIRISIDKLKKSENLAIEGANNGTMITICKYDDYQILEKQKGKQKGNEGANKGQQLNKETNNTSKDVLYHPNFYQNEILHLNGHELSPAYRQLVDFLNGKNETKEPLKNVLSIKKQISFDQFVQLMKVKPKEIKLGQILLKIENDPKYYKNKTNLYITLKNWVTSKFVKN